MKLINESFLEIKKSKFYGLLYEIDSIDEVLVLIKKLEKKLKRKC